MNVKERIEVFNEENRPFYLVDLEDGKFSLCLPLDCLRGEYEDFGQAAFDAYAIEIGEPPVDDRGIQTHGNGYEWEAAFYQAFADDPNIDKIMFDCEAGGFFCDSTDLSLLEDFGKRFKEICEDTERFKPIVSEGIKNAEARQAEKEHLMRTVKGRLMWRPQSTFDIMTPDGNIRLTPEDTKQLLDGTMQFVKIDNVTYAAYELLDQEITNMQVDIFDHNLIRMKTEEPEQEITPEMKM